MRSANIGMLRAMHAPSYAGERRGSTSRSRGRTRASARWSQSVGQSSRHRFRGESANRKSGFGRSYLYHIFCENSLGACRLAGAAGEGDEGGEFCVVWVPRGLVSDGADVFGPCDGVLAGPSPALRVAFRADAGAEGIDARPDVVTGPLSS